MNYLYTRYKRIRNFIDIPVLIVSYLLTVLLLQYFRPDHHFTFNLSFVALALTSWYLCALISNLYIDRRSNRFSEEVIFIFYTLLLFTFFLAASFFFLNIYNGYDIYFFSCFNALFCAFQITVKYFLRKRLQFAFLREGTYDSLLLLGSTQAAREFHETVNIHFYYGYKCAGLLGDERMEWDDCPYLGKTEELKNVLKKQLIDEVVITLPNSKMDEIKHYLEVCDQMHVRTRIIPDFYQYSANTSKIEYIGLIPVLKLKDLPLDKKLNKVIKRAFDVLFSLTFFLLIGIWLFPVIALLVKFSSKGPVFFKQERWGLNNESIILYKFRTMRADASQFTENGKFALTVKNDPRVTLLGKYLRRISFDELPQFWNVLIGNMSVVGPRPHATPMNIESMHTVDNYLLRHVINPGITGWAQVNGSRGETNTPGAMETRVRFDLYYINKWTFWLDCQIILQTIVNIIKGDENAY
jgi:putative colanic acid biosynthesis UDP-glucose lipid carrier transferase